MIEVEEPGVDDVPVPQCGPHRPVQAVLEIDFAFPLHRVSEQVAVERRILGQQLVEREHGRDGGELVEPELPRWDLRPVADGQLMIRIRFAVADALENHRFTVTVMGRRRLVKRCEDDYVLAEQVLPIVRLEVTARVEH
jgi:hypothetical protein